MLSDLSRSCSLRALLEFGLWVEVHWIVGPETAMKYFRLFLLLLILRPCPACLANEVVAEIVAPQAVDALSANAIHDFCECPCPNSHGHDRKPQQTPDQPTCPCCSPDYWPATLTSSLSPPQDGSDAGTLSIGWEVDVTQSTFAKTIATTREALPDRNDMSLPLLI